MQRILLGVLPTLTLVAMVLALLHTQHQVADIRRTIDETLRHVQVESIAIAPSHDTSPHHTQLFATAGNTLIDYPGCGVTCRYIVTPTVGPRGLDGANGTAGADGADGTNGTNGTDGSIAQWDVVLLAGRFTAGCAALPSAQADVTTRTWNYQSQLRGWLAGNVDRGEITLAANATYLIEASAPASSTNGHTLTMSDATTNVVLALGTTEFAPANLTMATRSVLSATLWPDRDTIIRFDHYTALAGGRLGAPPLGIADETYEQLKITRLTNPMAAYPVLAINSAVTPTSPYITLYAAPAFPSDVNSAFPLAFASIGAASRACLDAMDKTRVYAYKSGTFITTLSLNPLVTVAAPGVVSLEIWLRVNGVDVPRSNTAITSRNDQKTLMAQSLLSLQHGDFVQVYYRSTSASGQGGWSGTNATASIPAAPAATFTLAWLYPKLASIRMSDASIQPTPAVSATLAPTMVTFDTIAMQQTIAITYAAGTGLFTLMPETYVVAYSIRITGSNSAGFAWLTTNSAGTSSVASSATKNTLASWEVRTISMTHLYNVAVNSTIGLVWTPDTAGVTILASPSPGTSPSRPAIPGASITITQVDSAVQSFSADSTTTQTALIANSIYFLSFSNIRSSSGITAVSASRFKFSQAATMAIYLGLTPNVLVGSITRYVWVRINGVDVPNTAFTSSSSAAANTIGMVSHAYSLRVAANDYIEFVWSATANSMMMTVGALGNRPALPSARLVMYQESIDAQS